MPWENSDGLTVLQPADLQANVNAENRGRTLRTAGGIKQIEMDVNFVKISGNGGTNFSADKNNDGTNDGFHGGNLKLPAYASILRATMIATEAATGGTSFTVGVATEAGAEIDNDGIFTATEGVIANVNTIGKRTYGNGAYVATTAGTASIGAADGYIRVATSGTFTAGKARLIIEYIDPLAD